MFDSTENVADFDPALWKAVTAEVQRQEDHVELIASENYVSPRVLELQGSVLTNKYAEGYPSKRYYGGCQFVDQAEVLAIERAKELFDAPYANVQPHSGSQANAAAYMALVNPGDKVMAMSLSAGGHLTHGSPVNFSGKLYDIVSYGVNEQTGLIDYDQMRDLALKHRPKLIVSGFSAYSRIMDWNIIAGIAKEIDALTLCDMAHVAGLVAAGIYPSPMPVMDVVTSTTHKTLRGPRGGLILAKNDEALWKRLNSAIFPGSQGGPLMHVIAAKAVAFKEALAPEFAIYQQQIVKNAKAMAAVMMQRGYKVVSEGTDNHLFLVDLTDKDITGKEAEAALGSASITVNKNTIPGETRSPFVTSGLRIGTPAITTRGMMVPESEQLGHWMCDVLDHISDTKLHASIKAQVTELCHQFPVYHPATEGVL
jgi:glycine hydroxymethyltransferase